MTNDGERFSLKFLSEGGKREFLTSEKRPKTCNKKENETIVYELAQQRQYFTWSKIVILLFQENGKDIKQAKSLIMTRS